MQRRRRFFILGSFLFTTSLFFIFSPMASTAFAATTPGVHLTRTMNIATTPGDEPDASINSCPPTQTENSSSNNTSWVEVIQFSLNALRSEGALSFPAFLSTDGEFGAKTETAVNAFQSFAGIGSSGDGVVGSRTWQALGFCEGTFTMLAVAGLPTFKNCPPTQTKDGSSNSSVLVEAIQDLLNIDFDNGVFPDNSPDSFTPFLTSDGSFGAQTKSAVVNFQFAAGLGSSGNGDVGVRTWSELGMCY